MARHFTQISTTNSLRKSAARAAKTTVKSVAKTAAKTAGIFALALFFAACSQKVIDTPQMHRSTMKTYTVGGVIYQPQNVIKGQTEVGIASWYGPDFHGRLTSNGETYNMNALTAAHKTMPMNTIVEVQNLDNGKKVEVRINDRGPFVAGRIIDLSKAAAKQLDVHKYGTARVRLTVVGFYSANSKNAEPSVVRVKGGEKILTQSSVQTYERRAVTDETAKHQLENSASNEARRAGAGGAGDGGGASSGANGAGADVAIDTPITIAANVAGGGANSNLEQTAGRLAQRPAAGTKNSGGTAQNQGSKVASALHLSQSAGVIGSANVKSAAKSAQKPAAKSAQTSQNAAQKPATSGAAAKNFGVQVGSFRDEASARAHQARFAQYSTAIKLYSGGLYRVFVTFESEAAARKFIASGAVKGAFLSRDF